MRALTGVCAPARQWKAFEGEVCVSGRAMVGRMLDTLHGEGEAAWVQTIARELCAGAAKFIHNPRRVPRPPPQENRSVLFGNRKC
jgi:hypothetical protein